MTPPFLMSPLLETPGAVHGFFCRIGGVSKGVYEALNTGPGSGDDMNDVAENRRRCADALGVAPARLLTNFQIHSNAVAVVDSPWTQPPTEADALVTNKPGLALGVLAADCMPWLFLEPQARVLGAAHAGWRGALAGVLENTIAAMEKRGAKRARIRAALGPCLRQPNFEVGLDLLETFTAEFREAERFFAAGRNGEKRQFDLVGFARWRLSEAGVTQIDDLEICTLASPEKYFSYRASRRNGDEDYGRNLSAIALA